MVKFKMGINVISINLIRSDSNLKCSDIHSSWSPNQKCSFLRKIGKWKGLERDLKGVSNEKNIFTRYSAFETV